MKSVDKKPQASIKIEVIKGFKGTDLCDLCDATESTMLDSTLGFSIGFDRKEPLVRERLEAYWKGVLLVPERELIVGRLDGVIVSSIQLVKPHPNNQTSSFAGEVYNHFVAPWARGYGLASELLMAAKTEARKFGLTVLRLNVAANLAHAISVYEACGYKRWGTLDKYEIVDGKMQAGYFYYSDL